MTRLVLLLIVFVVALSHPAMAAEVVDISGHVKAFGVATIPYESRLMPAGPTGSATFDSRIKIVLTPFDGLRFEVHPTLTALVGGRTGISTGVDSFAPEALPLTGVFAVGDTFGMRFRMDRLNMRVELGPVRITAGRQAITFGQGTSFTPMDLVAPFTPATLDTSYKPGVDAVRADLFLGMAGQVSVLAAYLGESSLDGIALLGHAQVTLGATDVAVLGGMIYGDPMVGVSVWAPIGPVGVYGDVTLTGLKPNPFVRAVVGAMVRPGPTTMLSAEVYGQRFGTSDKSEYLLIGMGERYQRSELWLSGHLYASVAVSQEITPLLSANVALLGNLLDPSFYLLPSISWAAAENADLSFGAQVGLGKRPDEDEDNVLRSGQSEFGSAPFSAFLQVGFYF